MEDVAVSYETGIGVVACSRSQYDVGEREAIPEATNIATGLEADAYYCAVDDSDRVVYDNERSAASLKQLGTKMSDLVFIKVLALMLAFHRCIVGINVCFRTGHDTALGTDFRAVFPTVLELFLVLLVFNLLLSALR